MPRFHCPIPLVTGHTVDLPVGAARHVQVLRMQPGMGLTLFNGEGGEFDAVVARMGRSDVQVTVGAHLARDCEAAVAVHLAVGMPANDRMDWLVEKATELGVASIQPLMTAHSVLRLKSERADKKQAHWQAIAVSACEQSGRNRLPLVHPVRELADWLTQSTSATAHPANPTTHGHGTEQSPPHSTERHTTQRLVLSLAEGTQALGALRARHPGTTAVWVLSGPEGGLSPEEDRQAREQGWQAVTLGARVLRAETAALAALASYTVA